MHVPSDQVYGLSVSEFDGFYAHFARTLLATIPCTLYGVWEAASRITSFDARDMEPHLITRERCPATFRSGQWCYCVYMQRASSLEFLRAYIPEEVRCFSMAVVVCARDALSPTPFRFADVDMGSAGGHRSAVLRVDDQSLR
jgi:hypothetical protein